MFKTNRDTSVLNLKSGIKLAGKTEKDSSFSQKVSVADATGTIVS